jgi:5'-nucleotidase
MRTLLAQEHRDAFLQALEKKIGRKLMQVDMDGVIADFDKAAEIWGANIGISGEEFKAKKMYRQPLFYKGLDLIPGAKDALFELDEHVEIRFLSAPSWGNPYSFTEKRYWIEEHFGSWGTKRMDLSFRKDLVMGHFLVDDRTKYGAGDFIGEHIMYGSEKFPDWNSVVKHVKDSIGINS